MTETEERPSLASLTGWSVSVTPYGTLEVLMVLEDKQEARAWAVWLADQPRKKITFANAPASGRNAGVADG